MTDHIEPKEAIQTALAGAAVYRGVKLCDPQITRTKYWESAPGTVTGASFSVSAPPGALVKKLIDEYLDAEAAPAPAPPAPPADDEPDVQFTVTQRADRVVVVTDQSTDIPDNATGQVHWGNGASGGIRVGNVASYQYPAPGSYQVTLVWSADAGDFASAKTVIVSDDGSSTTPAPAPEPAPAPPPAPADLGQPPASPQGDGAHKVVLNVTDADGIDWAAVAYVGDDPTAAAVYCALVDAAGRPHPRLTAWFYADCVEAGVTRLDADGDEIGCVAVIVTYDGQPVDVPVPTNTDDTFDFWRGCRCPAIRYGTQVGWSEDAIDWTLLPHFSGAKQRHWDDSIRDYSFNGLGNATTRTMGQGGARPDLGYMPVWNMAFLLDPCDETWDVIRRSEDHIGGWGMVYVSDPATGHIVDIHTYPDTTTLPQAQVHSYDNNLLAPYRGSYRGATLVPVSDGPNSWRTTASPMKPNGAHLTGYAMLAAMVTGTARDRDHASFWANWPLLEINPRYTRSGGVAMGAQRRFAWCLRNLFMASYISSDRQYFADETARNLDIAMAHTTNPFGAYDVSATYPRDPDDADGYRGLAPWMQYYLTIVVDVVWHKNPAWKPFAQFLAKFLTTWATKPYALCATAYCFMCKDPEGNDLTDFDAMVNRSLLQIGYTQEQADAVTSATTDREAHDAVLAASPTWPGKFVDGVSDLRGSILATDSYPAMCEAAMTCVANTGAFGALMVCAWWMALPTRPDWAHAGDRKFDLVPRNVPAGGK